jgi:hypothetical protein
MKRQGSNESPAPSKKAKIGTESSNRAVTTDPGHFPDDIINIVSWNVNGLRSAKKKQGFRAFTRRDFDIFCLNETKL